MKGKKHLSHLLNAIFFALPLGLISSRGLPRIALAFRETKGIESSWQIAQTFQPPPGGTEISTAAAGTRGGCDRTEKPLVPLLPQSNWGLTLSKSPTFFVYVPPTKAKQGQFSIVDEDKKEVIYETSFSTPSQPGIVSVSLPASENGLEVGKRYSWTFQVECPSNPEQSDESGSPFVQGYVERIKPSQELVDELDKAADESDRAQVYAKNGIWHETVLNSAKERGSNRAAWEQLLNSVGLSEIAKEPLVECCQARN